jgi:hypothetical protein
VQVTFAVGNRLFAVVRPTHAQLKVAERVRMRELRRARRSGARARPRVEDVMRAKGLWDDARAAELGRLNALLDQLERAWAGGHRDETVATQLRQTRRARGSLLRDWMALDGETAEALAHFGLAALQGLLRALWGHLEAKGPTPSSGAVTRPRWPYGGPGRAQGECSTSHQLAAGPCPGYYFMGPESARWASGDAGLWTEEDYP